MEIPTGDGFAHFSHYLHYFATCWLNFTIRSLNIETEHKYWWLGLVAITMAMSIKLKMR